MEFETVDSYEGIAQLRDAWKATLVEGGGIVHPFHDPDLNLAYIRHFIPECHLNAVLSSGTSYRSILPLYRSGRIYRSCGLIGDDFFDYTDIIGHPKNSAQLVDMLTAAKAETFQFMRVREDSALASLIPGPGSLGGSFSALVEESVQAPYISLKNGSWGAYYESLSKNTKSDLRRKNNRLKDSGSVEFMLTRDAINIKLLLPDLIRQHITRREELGQAKSLFLDEKFASFFNEALEILCSENKVYLFHLNLSGRAIAFCLCFLYENRLYYYMPTFDSNYHRSSPGTLLLAWIIEYCCTNGIEELDLMIGDEDYKAKFSNGRRSTLNIFIYRNSLRGRLGQLRFFTQRVLRHIRQKAVQSPLKPLRRKLMKLWYRLR